MLIGYYETRKMGEKWGMAGDSSFLAAFRQAGGMGGEKIRRFLIFQKNKNYKAKTI